MRAIVPAKARNTSNRILSHSEWALPARKRSLMVTAVRRRVQRLHLLQLFGDKIALRRDCLAAKARPHHLMDTLGDSRLPIHENAQVVGIEHEQAGSSDGGHGRRPARTAERRDLAEEMTG